MVGNCHLGNGSKNTAFEKFNEILITTFQFTVAIELIILDL